MMATKQQVDGGPPENATALDASQTQMQKELQQQQQGNRESDADGQQIRFTTAYKRYRKLLQEEQQRPQPVNLQNMPELEATVQKVMKRTTQPNRQRAKPNRRVRSKSFQEEAAATNDDDVFVSADEEEKQPQHPANDYFATPERVQRRRAEVMTYVNKKSQQLGLTDQGQLLRPLRGEMVPIKTSSVDKILDYHWSSPTERANRNPPPGYAKFMQTARADPFLGPRLFTPSREETTPKAPRRQQTHSMCTLSGKGFTKQEHKKREAPPSYMAFKPTLW